MRRTGAVAQLGERRVRNAKVGSSILLRSTTIPRPTSIGWAFSYPGSATPRRIRRRSACATRRRPGVRNAPGSTLSRPLFSQNLRHLLRRSARTRPSFPATCACVAASRCPASAVERRRDAACRGGAFHEAARVQARLRAHDRAPTLRRSKPPSRAPGIGRGKTAKASTATTRPSPRIRIRFVNF